MRPLALAVVAACGSRAGTGVPSGAQVGPALAAALTAAAEVHAPWRCAAPDGPEHARETLTVGEHTWTITGHTLGREGSGDVVIGAIADAAGAAPATLAAIGRLRTRLARADVVLTLGGMGTTQAELEATLGALADGAPFLVVALPGDLEGAGALAAAVTTLRGRGQQVLDGRLIQRIELPGATIATLAGARDPSRLVAGTTHDDGCALRAEDVALALVDLTARPALRITATTEAPRTVTAGEPSGDRELTAGAGHELDVALHGPTSVAPSRARSGGRDADAVPLTPGSADAVPRLDDPAHAPSAGLLVLHAGGWAWKPVADTTD